MLKELRPFFPLRFSMYLASLGFYHWAEYLYVCLFHYENLNFDSFLLNQSIHYVEAIIVSFMEGIVTQIVFPEDLDLYIQLADRPLLINGIIGLGLVMMVAGHYFRIMAEMTAGRNFNHQIQWERENSHRLVTDGVYRISRHPSYLGWYLWAVGTQVMMMSAISTILFIGSSWIFFNRRIKIEEKLLIEFFGEEYRKYQREVPIRIPFIKGHTKPPKSDPIILKKTN
jgi:protein-S-isoprenylcysteine O-methyltransferase